MMQKSGVGNAVNPLTSLNQPFRIPALLVVTWRGEPGFKDEPQHALMGRITQNLLRVIEVQQGVFPQEGAEIAPALDAAATAMAEGRAAGLSAGSGTAPSPSPATPRPNATCSLTPRRPSPPCSG